MSKTRKVKYFTLGTRIDLSRSRQVDRLTAREPDARHGYDIVYDFAEREFLVSDCKKKGAEPARIPKEWVSLYEFAEPEESKPAKGK